MADIQKSAAPEDNAQCYQQQGVSQPEPQAQPGNPKQQNSDWHYGLCTCCSECGACCEAWCCHPCQLSRQCNMLSNGKPEIHWPLCLLIYCGGLVLPANIASCIMAWQNRDTVRTRYGIDGGACSDCCCSYFCTCCVIQQMLLEMSAMMQFPGATCCYNPPQCPTGTGMA